ncbi:pentatricopeptide repeat-containing protein At1g43980, mitochondrial-like isoform X1 [Nymphaea colorata]|nr:pentatricopeptide repeat-containing protein At1g43980, mitochondrial-like isoform X1 [Nymphaea colorata]XP_031473903.1 pentatricopeptide repeat-containing protein At1g43980, mitochondrial-like isoform X1 [Nymphaea colorata]XP_031473904.1 pentatricopeptide repeat-containing protein At1g43980, mitochondrial-like isoform X1 [Nymphaea colorata]
MVSSGLPCLRKNVNGSLYLFPIKETKAATKRIIYYREDIIQNCVSLLNQSISSNCLAFAQSVHSRLIRLGLSTATFFGNQISSLYYSLGESDDGFKAINDTPKWNIFSWNILLGGLVRNGEVESAQKVFGEMPQQDVVSWNSLLSGFFMQGEHGAALTLITEMWERRIRPTGFTFSIIISVGVSNIWHGKQVHANILRNCLHDNLILNNALICMYGRFSNVSYAFHLFYGMEKWDVVSWNAIMYACVRSGKPEQALTLYQRMRAIGFIHDQFTISTMVVACANLLDTIAGNEIFGVCIKTGFLSNSVVCSSIIDMFAKFNRLEDSIQLFEEMPQRDIAIFNSIISSVARLGFVEDALSFFTYAMRENNKPTEFTFGSVLGCAACIVSIEQGRQLHSLALKVGFEADFVVSNSLMDMYAKTGNIDCAMKVFANMHSRDLVSWNTMIMGCSRNGEASMALQLLKEMCSKNVLPDKITFFAVLLACSNGGLVNEGSQLFSCMEVEHGVMPDIEHYTCMVDMLSRAGRLKQAMEVIKSMPYEPSALIWGLLLRACRLHADIGITQQVAESLVALEPRESLPYVVLAQVYAMKCHWESVVRLRRMMKVRCLKEAVGCSWIIMRNKLAVFREDNMVHPGGEAVYNTLRLLWWDIQEMDYLSVDYAILGDLSVE